MRDGDLAAVGDQYFLNMVTVSLTKITLIYHCGLMFNGASCRAVALTSTLLMGVPCISLLRSIHGVFAGIRSLGKRSGCVCGFRV